MCWVQMAGLDPEATRRSREVRDEQMRVLKSKSAEERAGAERYCKQSASNLQTLKDMLPGSQSKADGARARREVGAGKGRGTVVGVIIVCAFVDMT